MLDYQRIVDDVRSSLYQANVEGADALRAPAADYLLACQEVGERLRQCGNLLRQGLRSEALQLAEVEPNLLDVVATLDFPERAAWQQLIQSFGIVAPPPLPIDVAADLNEAYAVEQPLTVLLQRHRLLALGQAPLRGRIAVMRQLAAVDANNPIWQEDLVVFERERQKEIQSELAEAARDGDLTTLTAVAEELSAEPWLELPPSPLVHWAEETRSRVAKRHARDELQRIEQELNEAHSALDEARGQQLRQQWQTVLTVCPLGPADPLLDQAQPALDWLDDCDARQSQKSQYENAIGNLEASLDQRQEPTLAQLERLYAAALRAGDGGEGLPRVLESRYRARVSGLQTAAGRKRRLIVACSALGILLLLGAVGAAIWYPLYWREIEAQAAAVEALISAGKLAEAGDYLERLDAQSPDIAREARLQKVQAELQSLLTAEQDRRAAFERTLSVAEQSLGETPDMVALAEAKKLAHTSEEKSQVLATEAKLLARTRGAQAARDETFRASMQGLVDRLQAISKAPAAEPAKDLAAVKQYKDDLQLLDRTSGQVSEALRVQTKPLWTRIAALETQAKNRVAEDADLAKVSSAVGRAEEYRQALLRFAKVYPQSAAARDFARAAAESGCSKRLEQWNALVAAWSRKPAIELDAAGAASYLALANETLKDCSEFPEAGFFRARLPYLEAIVRRGGDAERIDAKLKLVFGDTLVSSVTLVEHKDGRRYYARFKPTLRTGKPDGFKYLSGFNLEEKGIAFKLEDVTIHDPAPHTLTAGEGKKLLIGLTDSNWEETFFKIARLLDKDDRIDPLLKLALLQQVLEVGSQGSPCFQKAFAPHVQHLKDANINPFANWLDPVDAEVKNVRAQAKTVLEKLPDVVSAGKVAKLELEKLRGLPTKSYRWVGWLQHGPGDAWQCRSLHPLEAGQLFVLRQGTDGQTLLEPIGEVSVGSFKIDVNSPERLLQGRPVLMAIPLNPPPTKKS